MNRDVALRVECLTPERLIERATTLGARFSSVRLRRERSLLIVCDAASGKLLLGLCERFSIPARVTRRRGGSAVAAFLRRRRTLAAGLAVFAALCLLFLSRVWIVDVVPGGEASVDAELSPIRDALDGLGVAPGMYGNNDTALLAREIQAQAEGFSYVGVRRQGIRLLVEAVPEIPEPGVYDVDAPRDLVSSCDGVVLSAVARSGQLCVKPGDVVRMGQTLIRGEELSADGETRLISALGEIVLRCWIEGAASLPTRERSLRFTGRTSFASRLTTPWFDWPIVRGERFSRQAVETQLLAVGGLFIPLEIERSTYRETEEANLEANEAELKARLQALAFADAARQLTENGLGDYEIADRWVDYDCSGGALRARAVYEIQVNAAVTREDLQGGRGFGER